MFQGRPLSDLAGGAVGINRTGLPTRSLFERGLLPPGGLTTVARQAAGGRSQGMSRTTKVLLGAAIGGGVGAVTGYSVGGGGSGEYSDLGIGLGVVGAGFGAMLGWMVGM